MYYTHAPYTLNLCNVIDIDDNWRYDILCNDLLNTQALNGCGVVVHVGQYKENKYSDAVEMMEYQIRQILDTATPERPLLLETPCGEGTEVCASMEEMANFFYVLVKQKDGHWDYALILVMYLLLVLTHCIIYRNGILQLFL